MPRCPPILKRPSPFSRNDQNDDHMPPRKSWTAYLGPLSLVVLLIIPQPSWFILLSSQYVSSSFRLPHAAITTTLTLLAINSLAICSLRDPGRPKMDDIDSTETNHRPQNALTVDQFDDEDEALLEAEEEDANDFNSARKWCRTCWAPKPDRTHHCSSCGRCVLRMDHHCPWVSQCVGHRTHAAFLHLLFCATLLSLYIGIVSSLTLYNFLFMPIAQPVQDSTPLHCLMLVIMGFIFAMTVGSFFGFHLYLCFTNQTTLEQLSPFLLLKYLPKPKTPRHAPGTTITHGSAAPHITRNVPILAMPAPVDESPYYFPSPPQTPPPPPLDTLRHALLASNPFSTIPPAAATSNSPSASRGLSPSHVFSGSPVATTVPNHSLPNVSGYHEWDEHSLSVAQRRLVRRTADRLGLWDLGWRRNVIATLGSGDPSMRNRGRFRNDDGARGEEGARLAGSSSASASRQRGRGSHSNSHSQARPYSWRWWLSVLLNGGPPRGDGRTFARNPKARFALEELRRGLEEAERRERGDAAQQDRVREDLAAGPRRGRHGPSDAGARTEETELREV